MTRRSGAQGKSWSLFILVLLGSLCSACGDGGGGVPIVPGPAPFPASVEGGNRHSLALKSDGTVWAWGGNDNGALGVGDNTDRLTPVQVVGLTAMTAISAGDGHSLALKNNGTVWAWGENFFGALGDGSTIRRLTPVQVVGLTGMSAVSAGGFFSIALKNDGTVWSWGSREFGQLGDDNTIGFRATPGQISGLSGILAISASQNHSLALRNDGTVWAWGGNEDGALGVGDNTDRLTPVQVSGPGGVGFLDNVAAIAAGENHSLALMDDGTVRAWGGNFFGALGVGDNTDRLTPVQVSGPGGVGFLDNVAAISAGGFFSIALKNDGTVWAWGSNLDGQLGDGTLTARLSPVQVFGLTGVSTTGNPGISAGRDHSLAVRTDETVWAWGSNGFGQLGDNTTLRRIAPVLVTDF